MIPFELAAVMAVDEIWSLLGVLSLGGGHILLFPAIKARAQ